MASRTQMRLAQLTGSFGNLPGQISDNRPSQPAAAAANAAALIMSSGSLLGPLTEMASAIKRTHGGDSFAAAGEGEFFAHIKPSSDGGKDLGRSNKQWGELFVKQIDVRGTTPITAILDDDSFSPARADALATQQSIKAYVDAQVDAQDLDGLADGSTTFTVDLDDQSLSILGGTGLTTVGNGAQSVTINLDNLGTAKNVGGTLKRLTATVDAQGRLSALGDATIQDATVSAKGVASFATGDFAVSTGAVTIKAAGVDFAQIQNVAPSSVMGVIGGSAAAPADIGIETSLAGNAGKLARADAIKTYSDGNLGGFTLDQSGKAAGHAILWDNTASAWESAAIAGTTNQVAVALGDGSLQIGLPNNVTIQNDLTVTGDLIVSGDQIVANVTDLQIEDKQIELNSPANGSPISNQGAGFFISGSAPSKNIIYSALTDGGRFELNTDHGVATGKAYFVNTNNVLNQTTLGTTVVASSLTSVGVLAGGSIASGFGNIDNGVSTLDSGAATLASVAVTGASVLNGAVTLGDDASDLITPNGVFAGDLVPNGGTRKIGDPTGDKWAELHIAGEAVIDNLKLDGNAIVSINSNGAIDLTPNGSGSVVISKIDVATGEIDGTVIGNGVAAAGTFTALACSPKALAAAALNITDESAIVLAAADEFVVQDADSGQNIKKTTLGAVQTFLAANGSEKHVLLQGADLEAGQPLDVGALSGITAANWHSAAEKQQEVYCNGQLLARGADAAAGMDWYKHSVSGQIKFGFDLEAEDVLQFVLRG